MLRIRQRAGLVVLLLGTGVASASDLVVRVNDQHGRPVADAVVTLVGATDAAGATGAEARPGGATRTIDQERLTFVPYVQTFRPGDAVVFRNSDSTRHHVYSFSEVKAFEFMLAPGASSTRLVLDQPGIVAVGCNIHDGMISYLYVSDAPWRARTDAQGRAAFDGLGAGRYDVRVWQPRLSPGRPDLVQEAVELRADESRRLVIAVTLRPDPRSQFDREHTRY